MSQSASLYPITKEDFVAIEKVNGKKIRPYDYTDEQATFAGTFMALEFILSKGQDKNSISLIEEIFNPKKTIGQKDTNNLDFSRLSEDELESLSDFIYYLSPEKVEKINTVLTKTDEQEVGDKYNADELNANQIYPWCWHDDDSGNLAFNKSDILRDFKVLRDFFSKAASSKNYILCYVG